MKLIKNNFTSLAVCCFLNPELLARHPYQATALSEEAKNHSAIISVSKVIIKQNKKCTFQGSDLMKIFSFQPKLTLHWNLEFSLVENGHMT